MAAELEPPPPATAADIVALMDLTRERVKTHFSVTLENEIRMIGE